MASYNGSWPTLLHLRCSLYLAGKEHFFIPGKVVVLLAKYKLSVAHTDELADKHIILISGLPCL